MRRPAHATRRIALPSRHPAAMRRRRFLATYQQIRRNRMLSPLNRRRPRTLLVLNQEHAEGLRQPIDIGFPVREHLPAD